MKNKIKKISKIVLIIVLMLLLQIMGYTYAKYITTEKGNGQAEIAKWAFKIVKEGQQTKNIQLLNSIESDKLVDGKIAPGTSGTMVISLDGTGSEVDINYALEFSNEKNKPNNITFTYNGIDYKSLSEIKTIKGIIKHNSEQKIKDIVIFWKWNYESGSTAEEITENDKLDTQDANNITKYSFDLTATGTQSE